MRLPASGKSRFKLGFFAVTGLFVLANLVTVVWGLGPFDWAMVRILRGSNEIGFPYHFSGRRIMGMNGTFAWEPLIADVVTCLYFSYTTGCIARWSADRKRPPDYLCKGCGYDLRGIPSSVCPECGLAAEQGNEPADP